MKRRMTALLTALAAVLSLAACGSTPAAEPPALEEIKTGYTAEQAEADGCVVMDGSQLLAGEALWYDFVNRSAAGCESTVRIYQGYSEQGGVYFVKQLHFDGERYALCFYDRTGDSGEEFLFEEDYAFLTRRIYTPFSGSETLTEGWLLTDDPDEDHEGFYASALSSTLPEDVRYAHCHPILGRSVEMDFLPGAFDGVGYADLDGDGKREQCRLGLGRTSGLFTFTLTVCDEDAPDREYVYCSEWYELSFLADADGTLRVRGITQDDVPVTRIFDLREEDGAVILVSDDGVELHPMG